METHGKSPPYVGIQLSVAKGQPPIESKWRNIKHGVRFSVTGIRWEEFPSHQKASCSKLAASTDKAFQGVLTRQTAADRKITTKGSPDQSCSKVTGHPTWHSTGVS